MSETQYKKRKYGNKRNVYIHFHRNNGFEMKVTAW